MGSVEERGYSPRPGPVSFLRYNRVMKKPLLVLVDGSAVFHRGYHAIPHLSNKEGLPTNAVYGFTTILLKVLGDLKPQYVIVTWDKGDETTFRKQKYPEYKATRKKQPDDLYAQIPTTRELVGALNLPWIELGGFEADDIIGTLAAKAEKRGGLETIIVTGDLDELQLVDANTRVYTMKRGFTDTVIYDAAAVKERYGVTPKQFIDVKALKGDASDNIPGVPGIGEKSAVDLIARYGSLDGVYEHLDELKGAQKAKLEAGKDLAYLSQELSTIVCDVPVDLDLESAVVGRQDKQVVHDLFRRLDFKSLLPKLPNGENGTAPERAEVQTLFGDGERATRDRVERAHLNGVTYKAIRDETELEALVERLAKAEVFAIDTETDSVNTFSANLVGVSVSLKEAEAFYVPVGHTDGLQLKCEEVVAKLKPVLEDPKVGKVGHNLKFDYQMLRRYGVVMQGIVFDTMIAAFLLNSLGRAQSLDDLAYSELGIEMIPISDLIGNGKKQVSFDTTLIEEATTYAAEDADVALRLYHKLREQLHGYVERNEYGWSMERLAYEVEWPIIGVLGEMELAGIELDVKQLRAFGERMGGKIAQLKGDIYAYAGEEFNLGSPAQLGQVLYGRLGLSTAGLKKGKTGISTAAGELEKLRNEHPVVELIMQYRELDKLKNTYVDALPGQVASDGRVHTSFSQVVAQTGRLSSSNPNLMNIPVRTELGREIRAAFVAPEGRVLVSADYSQIELRVAAALAGDEAMIGTFKAGIDLHKATAAELFGVPLEEVTKTQRSAVKAINFGVLYGMSAHGLSVATGMEGKEAAGFIERYFEVRPKLREYIDVTKRFAWDNQYTATLFGRRRPCPEIRSNNYNIRQGAERMAVNVPIQGTAADIYKLAMIELARRLDDDTQLLLQIHDELIVEAPESKGAAVAEMMREVMSGVIDLGVPLAVDTGVGKNWGELK
jgi:DNA polymerase-1